MHNKADRSHALILLEDVRCQRHVMSYQNPKLEWWLLEGHVGLLARAKGFNLVHKWSC